MTRDFLNSQIWFFKNIQNKKKCTKDKHLSKRVETFFVSSPPNLQVRIFKTQFSLQVNYCEGLKCRQSLLSAAENHRVDHSQGMAGL